jgi:hypothetical protein
VAALAAVLSVIAVTVSSSARSIWPPVACLMAIALTMVVRERLRGREGAPLNAGVLYMAVVTLYGLYPLLEYAALGGVYTPLNDPRLFDIQPGPEVVSRIGWYCVAYGAAFLAAYCLATRNASGDRRPSLRSVSKSLLWAVLLVFASLRGLVLLADVIFAAGDGGYVESYLRYSHLPLLAQQLLGHANGMLSVLGIALVTLACLDWRRLRWWLLGWLALEFFGLVAGGGSRTDFVLLILALAVAYHMLVRPISTGMMVGGGLLMVAGFLGLGAVRAYEAGGTVGAGLEILATANEFESLFGNAVDLDRMIESGRVDRGTLGMAVYFGDIIGLVPQQLMPFEKVNLTRWYVETFYQFHAELGGGFAFGVIAEALVGAGPVDLLWRAALVGFVLGSLDRRIVMRPVSLPGFVLYVWVLSNCYLMFRITTLGLVPILVYRVLPVLAVVLLLAELLERAGRPRTAVSRAPSKEVG